MLLTIGKPPEFDEHGLPIRGQCNPRKEGWRLRLIENGKEELLFAGSYETCRKIQDALAGKEADKVRGLISILAEKLAAQAKGGETSESAQE
ncbi:MAG: hypothetical protein JXA52_10470 [Planctomycetes bacterium]|nr:hypothetical protein [Planctomycetota bacterium]